TLRNAMTALGHITQLCLDSGIEPLIEIGKNINPAEELRDRIAQTIVDDAPIAVNRGSVIREGFNAELDELRRIATGGKDFLLEIQRRESADTGIPSLKIGFNNVFGYYIEVTNTHRDKVPEQWIRKQTLVNAERYITPELKEYEEKILGAQEKIEQIESRLFAELLAVASNFSSTILTDARMTATLDVLLTFCIVAMANRYNRPVVDDSLKIELRNARHPVIERELPPGTPYIANDITLDNESTQIMMITGPNMSGKSALLRSTALNVLMAQIGSFIPCDSAHIGVVDKIFTRVGASDNIALGESTFMVEMNEAASILNNMSQRSLILFDELGRGTSTYDGISIAWAIVEHIHEYGNMHPKT
ncbi:MAG: DNA mismatch repair protein MutS, partial [Muribaculaceae bacterium]|nr:DNA mismatch repair protein MutS [Muribaculaceae bacterium]